MFDWTSLFTPLSGAYVQGIQQGIQRQDVLAQRQDILAQRKRHETMQRLTMLNDIAGNYARIGQAPPQTILQAINQASQEIGVPGYPSEPITETRQIPRGVTGQFGGQPIQQQVVTGQQIGFPIPGLVPLAERQFAYEQQTEQRKFEHEQQTKRRERLQNELQFLVGTGAVGSAPRIRQIAQALGIDANPYLAALWRQAQQPKGPQPPDPSQLTDTERRLLDIWLDPVKRKEVGGPQTQQELWVRVRAALRRIGVAVPDAPPPEKSDRWLRLREWWRGQQANAASSAPGAPQRGTPVPAVGTPPVAPGAVQAVPAMPQGMPTLGGYPASQFTGRTIRDAQTGKRYRSNGQVWVEVP